jgi:hypothetical protein
MQALRVAGETSASRPRRAEGVGAAFRALLEFYAERELFARLAFVELPTAGPGALDRADQVLDLFTSFLKPNAALSDFDSTMPEQLVPAIASAIWAAIQLEVVNGRLAALPEMAPEVTLLAVGPLNRR